MKRNGFLKKIAMLLAVALVVTGLSPAGIKTAYAKGFRSSDGGLKLTDVEVLELPEGYEVTDVSVKLMGKPNKLSPGSKALKFGDYGFIFKITVTLNKEITQEIYDATDGCENFEWNFTVSYDDDKCHSDGKSAKNYTGGKGEVSSNELYYTSSSYAKTKTEDKKEDKNDDDDDDDNSSSGMSYEERQREEAKHFAPDASTLTAEQSAGWSLVSREAPAVSSSAGGVTAVSAYQGPMCRAAFQLAAPGYSIGHTYNMTLSGAGGSVSMKVPTDLVKAGRKYAIACVSGGRYLAVPDLTPDATGKISFNPASLGLPANSDIAFAIMYSG